MHGLTTVFCSTPRKGKNGDCYTLELTTKPEGKSWQCLSSFFPHSPLCRRVSKSWIARGVSVAVLVRGRGVHYHNTMHNFVYVRKSVGYAALVYTHNISLSLSPLHIHPSTSCPQCKFHVKLFIISSIESMINWKSLKIKSMTGLITIMGRKKNQHIGNHLLIKLELN